MIKGPTKAALEALVKKLELENSSLHEENEALLARARGLAKEITDRDRLLEDSCRALQKREGQAEVTQQRQHEIITGLLQALDVFTRAERDE